MAAVESERRHRRPAVSCTLCRRRKIRCNRETPCSNCVRSKNEACVYESHVVPHVQLPGSSQGGASSISTASTPPATDVESLKNRIKELEVQLQQVKKSPAASQPWTANFTSNVEAGTTSIGGSFFIHHGNPALGQHPIVNRSISHKKRMFGQSHWMNYGIILLRDIAGMLDEHAREALNEPQTEEMTHIQAGMQKVKRMARIIKSRWTPPWPCSPTPDLPPKDIADELVDCYLRTSERVYRVIHVPSFRAEYEILWETGNEPDKTFLVLLKLVLAIGATSYNDTFALRPTAIRWVYEAEGWISHPMIKHRLGLQYLQIHALLLIAREMVAVGEDLVWISAGTLLRVAIHMGLHRDPGTFPGRTIFANEMHRRLWTTIVELCLQSSLNSGGPPLISVEDFDTRPPENFDDEQLTIEDAVPKPENEYTHVSVAIALRKTVTTRLAITRFLNNFTANGSYEETLRLDTEFRETYKSLRSTFQALNSAQGPRPSQFEVRLVDIILHRYVCTLHMSFFTLALHETAYAYSRKIATDSSLKIWYAANLPSAITVNTVLDANGPPREDSLSRMIACGNGFLRSAILLAILVIAVDLREQIQEDGLGLMPARRDLVAVVEGAKAWSLWCIEAGETNIKGHMFKCVMAAHIEGLMKGLSKVELAKSLIKALEDAQERGTAILEKRLEQDAPEQPFGELDQMSLNVDPEIMEDWDFTVRIGMMIGGPWYSLPK